MDLEQIKNELGVPANSSFSHLVYNQPSQTIVIELVLLSQTSSLPLTRLYYRKLESNTYKMIGSPEDSTSYRNPISSSTSPTLIFSVWGIDGAFQKVCSYNLIDETMSDLLLSSDILSPVDCKRCWISTLLSFNKEAEKIYAVMAIEVSRNLLTTEVNYFCCEVSWRSKSVQILTRLDGVFF